METFCSGKVTTLAATVLVINSAEAITPFMIAVLTIVSSVGVRSTTVYNYG